MPFDPDHLTPAASLNRVPFVAAPELGIPPHMRGQTAFSLLSASAFETLVRQRGEALQLGTAELEGGQLSFNLRERLTAAAGGRVVRLPDRLGQACSRVIPQAST